MAGARCPMLRSEKKKEKERKRERERRGNPRREGTSEERFQNPSSWRVAQTYTRKKLSKSRTRKSARPHRQLLNKERSSINHPTPLLHLLCIFLLVGKGPLCALNSGKSRRAGDKNPALLLLCSNWPQQPAVAQCNDLCAGVTGPLWFCG